MPLPTNSAASAPSSSARRDRKSTRLNSSHGYISYAVFCLKKKNRKDSVNIARGTTARIVIAERPARLTAPFGIDEGRLVKEVETLHDDEEADEIQWGA